MSTASAAPGPPTATVEVPVAADGQVVRGGHVRAGRLLTAYVAALSVLLIGLVVTFALLLVARDHHGRDEASRRDALAAASAAMPKFGAVDFTKVEATRAAVLTVVTPRLGADLVKTLGPLDKLIVDGRVTASIAVRQAQVIDVPDSNTVRVLIYLDQTSTKASTPAPTVAPEAFTLVMKHVGGRWLVDQGGPAA